MSAVRDLLPRLMDLSHAELAAVRAIIDGLIDTDTKSSSPSDKQDNSASVPPERSASPVPDTVLKAADDHKAVDLSKLEIRGADPSDFRRNGALRTQSCRDLTQALILERGAISNEALEMTIDTWCAKVATSKLKSATLRGWLSRWKTDGYISSVPGRRGAYYMTPEQISEARRRNSMVADQTVDEASEFAADTV